MKNPKLHLTFQSKVGKGFVLVWSLNVILNEIGLQIQQLTLTLTLRKKSLVVPLCNSNPNPLTSPKKVEISQTQMVVGSVFHEESKTASNFAIGGW